MQRNLKRNTVENSKVQSHFPNEKRLPTIEITMEHVGKYGNAPWTVIICDCGNNEPICHQNPTLQAVMNLECQRCERKWFVCKICDNVCVKYRETKQIKRHMYRVHRQLPDNITKTSKVENESRKPTNDCDNNMRMLQCERNEMTTYFKYDQIHDNRPRSLVALRNFHLQTDVTMNAVTE